MLDIGFHQGASLYSHTPQDELRLVAVASSHADAYGLETLWQVCLHLQRLGYPVVVLDGTAHENESSPGLQDLLANAPWSDSIGPGSRMDASALAVLPAALGLQSLSANPRNLQQPLQPLEPLFRRYALVVLYAPVSTLASPLLAGTMTTPLLIMTPGKSGVVNSYRQLKHLALHAGLTGTVACMTRSNQTDQHSQGESALQSLRQCAARHLGQRIRTTLIRTESPQDLQRLALQLIENACTISAQGTATTLPSSLAASTPAHIVQSH